jgi:hypothetical protein
LRQEHFDFEAGYKVRLSQKKREREGGRERQGEREEIPLTSYIHMKKYESKLGAHDLHLKC